MSTSAESNDSDAPQQPAGRLRIPSTHRGPSPTSRPSCPTAPDTSSAALRHHVSARRLAVSSTSSSIASVSRPVNVFCWLGW